MGRHAMLRCAPKLRATQRSYHSLLVLPLEHAGARSLSHFFSPPSSHICPHRTCMSDVRAGRGTPYSTRNHSRHHRHCTPCRTLLFHTYKTHGILGTKQEAYTRTHTRRERRRSPLLYDAIYFLCLWSHNDTRERDTMAEIRVSITARSRNPSKPMCSNLGGLTGSG